MSAHPRSAPLQRDVLWCRLRKSGAVWHFILTTTRVRGRAVEAAPRLALSRRVEGHVGIRTEKAASRSVHEAIRHTLSLCQARLWVVVLESVINDEANHHVHRERASCILGYRRRASSDATSARARGCAGYPCSGIERQRRIIISIPPSVRAIRLI